MEKNAIMQWTKFVSFVILLIGGLNYLLMGLLEFNLFGEIFGYSSLAGRIVFSVIGLAAVLLVSIIIWKAYYNQESKPTTRRSPAQTGQN